MYLYSSQGFFENAVGEIVTTHSVNGTVELLKVKIFQQTVKWPSTSFDLTPLNYFLYYDVKSQV